MLFSAFLPKYAFMIYASSKSTAFLQADLIFCKKVLVLWNLMFPGIPFSMKVRRRTWFDH